MAQKHNDQYYHARWRRVVNVMLNSNLNISRIAPAGSRARKEHNLESDFDVIFAVSQDPERVEFYPRLIDVLEANFRYDDVYLGENGNVVHLDFRSGGLFDLVLLTEREFDLEYNSIKNFRKRNLM
ncbi:MAG: hypothetical protein ACFFDF_22280 [Candidatus Odinarchaeota archaeon]